MQCVGTGDRVAHEIAGQVMGDVRLVDVTRGDVLANTLDLLHVSFATSQRSRGAERECVPGSSGTVRRFAQAHEHTQRKPDWVVRVGSRVRLGPSAELVAQHDRPGTALVGVFPHDPLDHADRIGRRAINEPAPVNFP